MVSFFHSLIIVKTKTTASSLRRNTRRRFCDALVVESTVFIGGGAGRGSRPCGGLHRAVVPLVAGASLVVRPRAYGLGAMKIQIHQKLFFPQPVVAPDEPGLWRLVEPYKFNGFTIPRGFRTDFDSIPRLPVLFDIFKGRTRAAALVHDYLYFIGFNRLASDRIFLRMMVAEGVKIRHALPIYAGVRLFGWLFHGPRKSKKPS